VTVSAGLPPNASESDAVAKLEGMARELNMPAEYITGVTGQSKELQKAYEAFMYAFLLSFVFMYPYSRGSVRIVYTSRDHLADTAALRALCIALNRDRRTDAEHLFRPRNPLALWNR